MNQTRNPTRSENSTDASLPASIELRAGSGSGTGSLREGSNRIGDAVVVVSITDAGSGVRIDWSIHNVGRELLELNEVRIRFQEIQPARVLAPGWTTSSTVRRTAPDQVLAPEHDNVTDRLRDHADLSRASQCVAAHQVMAYESGVIGFLHGERHFGLIEPPAPRSSGPGTAAVALLDGVELGPGERLDFDPLWVAAGDPSALLAEFHDLWAVTAQATERARVRTGIGWWTTPSRHGDVALLAASVDIAADLGLAHVILGSGAAVLDDLVDPRSGANSAHKTATARAVLDPLASRIRKRGLRPGLRCRPFAIEPDTPFMEHVVEQRPGVARRIHGFPVADLTSEKVLNGLTAAFAARRQAGWDVFLLEDVWSGAVAGRRQAGQFATRAEGLRAALQAIREGAGDDAILIADGTPPGVAAGIVDRVVTGDLGRSSWVHHSLGHRRLWSAGPAALDLAAEFVDERRGVVDVALAAGGCVALTGNPLSDDLGRAIAAYLLDLAPAADVPVQIADVLGADRQLTAGPFTRGPAPSEYTRQISQ
jgi:hypothetical protein